MPQVGRISYTHTGRLGTKAYRTKLQAHVDGASMDTVAAIETDVKAGQNGHAAPYKTGNLRRSYHPDFKKFKSQHVIEFGNDPRIANYAVYVELGTRFMAARPHLVPATEFQRTLFMERVAKHIAVDGF